MLAPALRRLENAEDEAWFWALIELDDLYRQPAKTHAEQQNRRIAEALNKLLAQDSVEFHSLLKEAVARLNSVDQEAACYLINGYLSDDMFNEYHNWVVSRGKAVWSRAVLEPDSLSDLEEVQQSALPDADLSCINGELDLVPSELILTKTGSEPPDFFYEYALPGNSVDWSTYAWRTRLPRLASLCKAAMDGLYSPAADE